MTPPPKLGAAVYVDTDDGWRSGQICDYQQTSLGVVYVVMLLDGEPFWTQSVEPRQTKRSQGER